MTTFEREAVENRNAYNYERERERESLFAKYQHTTYMK